MNDWANNMGSWGNGMNWTMAMDNNGTFPFFNFTSGNTTWQWPIWTLPDISVYKYVELAFMALIFLLGTPGNLLIIIVQVKNPTKSTTDYYVMLMAVYEFICTTVNVPVTELRNNNWVWPHVGNTFLCVLSYFTVNFTLNAASLHLAAIAVDRCIKTCLPLNTFYNETVAKRTCVVIFFLAVLLAAPYGTMFYWNDAFRMCVQFFPQPLVNPRTWGLVVTCVGAVLFFIMFFSYLGIIISLRRRHNRKVALRVNRKALNKTRDPPQVFTTADIGVQENSSSIQATSQTILASNSTVQGDATTGNIMHSTSMPDNPSINPDQISVTIQNGHSSNVHCPSNDKSKTPRSGASSKKHRVGNILKSEGRDLNKLTVIMLMISVIYMATYIINWLLYVLGPNAFGLGFLIMSYSIPMINCSTNAVIFFVMSSRFRANAKHVICRR